MNRNITELKAPFAEIFARRGSKPAGALLTWAEGGTEPFITGVARFLDERPQARPMRDYGSVRLREEWLPLAKALQRLDATVFPRRGRVGFAFGKFQQSCYLERRLTDSFENLTGWPEWVVVARRDGNSVQSPSGAAVSHGLPPFEYADRAIEDWLYGVVNPQGGQARHLGELILVAPDTRGTLKSVKWEGAKLSGTIHTRADHAALELQVVLDTESGRKHLDPIRPVPSAFIWDTPKDARWAEIFLVHSSRDLMGKVRVAPGAEVSAEARALSAAEQARKDLLDWESHLVEFKPFIDRNDSKESELVESAIAFANTDGGRIYVGVGKDREPEGDRAYRRVLQSDKPEAIENYRKHLDEVIRERVKPVPFFTIEQVHLLGRPVFVIAIEVGRDKPYSTMPGNDVYIRHGSSNRRPDPRTEMPRSESAPFFVSGTGARFLGNL